MKEKELRSAKTYFEHQVDIEEFKKNTFEKLEKNSYIQQTNIVNRRRKSYPKWILAAAASVMIIGSAFTFGGTHITNAAETLINQLFGSKENLMQAYPEESQGELDFFDRHLEIAKENLTEKEFNDYTQLYKEQTEILNRIQKENRENPNAEEELKLDQIQESMETYENKFQTTEAKQMASFPFTKPKYLPEGYTKNGESYPMQNSNSEPAVSLDFSNGEFVFWTKQVNINQKDFLADMQETGLFKKDTTYRLNGFQFDYISTKDKSVGMKYGMRVTVPEKGYKIVLFAESLSKEEMEKVLLSMVED
ncbi:hypothetical protein ERJ70_14000 [Sediminibacillus dalangtanensis]|uniref:DUF4367 domain-containing protein n=1 Tax=Sediminibacillus dalangtanensis TaxID=2729421 RepID=A0ABX7VUV3_9BACI|nr:hypothetical protein [Sediminibacillus dalangtanensis]QTN00314.1 hypothetical protein ERJ70_14000 [Sediminibacillus dalangtanensis]